MIGLARVGLGGYLMLYGFKTLHEMGYGWVIGRVLSAALGH